MRFDPAPLPAGLRPSPGEPVVSAKRLRKDGRMPRLGHTPEATHGGARLFSHGFITFSLCDETYNPLKNKYFLGNPRDYAMVSSQIQKVMKPV
jgi:hypothetical protein